MKKLIIASLILTSIKLSAQENQTLDLIFDNQKFIYFKNANGVDDGVRLGRHSGNALRMKYIGNGFMFDALDNKPVQFRNASDEIKVQIHPAGDSYFIGGNLGIGTTSPSYKLDVTGEGRFTDRLYLDPDSGGGADWGNGWASYSLNSSTNFVLTKIGTGGAELEVKSIGGTPENSEVLIAGKLGIGTVTPTSALQVGDDNSADDANLRISGRGQSRKSLQFYRVGTVDAEIFEDTNEDFNMFNHFSGKSIIFGTESVEKMRINSSGQVGIGTASTGMGTHKLTVEGTIGAREIKVEATGWSDFVFYNDYNLLSLEEVEKYITKNNHLPEIPSEAEVLEDGINLGEMNAKLLQKIEELTLYLIEQNKEIKGMRSELDELKKEK